MKEKILTPKEWLKKNKGFTTVNFTDLNTDFISPKACEMMLKKYSDYVLQETKKELIKEIEEIRQLTKCEKVYTPNIHSIDIDNLAILDNSMTAIYNKIENIQKEYLT